MRSGRRLRKHWSVSAIVSSLPSRVFHEPREPLRPRALLRGLPGPRLAQERLRHLHRPLRPLHTPTLLPSAPHPALSPEGRG